MLKKQLIAATTTSVLNAAQAKLTTQLGVSKGAAGAFVAIGAFLLSSVIIPLIEKYERWIKLQKELKEIQNGVNDALLEGQKKCSERTSRIGAFI